MTDTEERAWIQGNRAAYRSILLMCAGRLSDDDLAKRVAVLEAERIDAIAALRDVCKTYGDNDWDETLHLADVIEKHLGRNLDDAARKRAEKGR